MYYEAQSAIAPVDYSIIEVMMYSNGQFQLYFKLYKIFHIKRMVIMSLANVQFHFKLLYKLFHIKCRVIMSLATM